MTQSELAQAPVGKRHLGRVASGGGWQLTKCWSLHTVENMTNTGDHSHLCPSLLYSKEKSCDEREKKKSRARER